MRDARRHRPARILILHGLAVLAVLVAGCAAPASEHAGASLEREETRGGVRYRLRSTVAPRRVTLGDPVRWTLAAEMPASVKPGRILRGRVAPELDLVPPKQAATRTEGDRVVTEWTYEACGFTLGRIALPLVLVPVQSGSMHDTLLFPADSLAVDSLTPAATGIVVPDRGPIAPKLRPVDYAVAGLGVLLLLAALLLGIRALRRRRAGPVAPAAPPEPAETRLRRVIGELRAEGERLPRDRFYEILSLAIRDYAAAITAITTRDRTTAEIVRELRSRGDVPEEGIEALGRALARSDLAKFARRGGSWDEALDVVAIAERLPDRLPARPPEPPAAEPAAAGAGER